MLWRGMLTVMCGQIGTVFASADYVCPNAVGVDIGTAALPSGSDQISPFSSQVHVDNSET